MALSLYFFTSPDKPDRISPSQDKSEKIIMPVTKSAQKALKQEKRRARENEITKKKYKKAIKAFKKTFSQKRLAKAYSEIDLAAKKNIIHANKAARLKGQLSKQAKFSQAKSKSRSKTKIKS